MAIIALPVTTRFLRKIDWSLDRPAQVNVSAYTGRRGVVANPWHGKWAASCEFAPVIGETNMRLWRAFFAKLKGQINAFRLPMTEGGQSGVTAGMVSRTSVTYPGTAGATNLIFDVPGHNDAGLTAGMFVTVNDQPLLLTATPTSDGAGSYILTFEPSLRASVAFNTAIEGQNPTCLVALTDSSFGYSVEPGKIYGMTMKVEEAF